MIKFALQRIIPTSSDACCRGAMTTFGSPFRSQSPSATAFAGQRALGFAMLGVWLAVFPLTAPASPPPAPEITLSGPTVNVKTLGAKGDGVSNDTRFFRLAAQQIQAAGGGKLVIPKGVYVVGEQIHVEGKYPYYQHQPIFSVEGVNGLVIEGSNATLRIAPGLRFGSFDKDTGQPYEPAKGGFFNRDYAVAVGSMVRITSSKNVLIRGLELDGNIGSLILGGYWGDVGYQLHAYGFDLYNNVNVHLERIHTHHHGIDGLVIGHTKLNESDPATPHTLVDVVSEYNARQGLSWVGGRGLRAYRCKFNHTGKARFATAPGAGLDIEAESAVCRDGYFEDCEFINNSGCGVTADCGDGGYSTFKNCTLWGTTAWAMWNDMPGMKFEECRFYGSLVHAYGSAERPDLATQYRRCHFEDKEYLNHGVYRSSELINHDGSAKNVLFEGCEIVANQTRAFWLAGGAILRDTRVTFADAKPDTGAFQALMRGGILERILFSEKYPAGFAKKYYIEAEGLKIGDGVTVDGPVVRWGNPVSGLVGAVPRNQVTLVAPGQPAATIVLPAATEFDAYVNATAGELEQYLKARLPQAGEPELAKARAALPALRAADAKRVGDEEKLAAEELVEFVRKMSGVTLPVVRIKPSDPLPAGNLILLGPALAERHGFRDAIAKLSPDGFIAAVRGDNVILTGRRARGTLYAAYELLESFGCRWIMPGAFGEFVPEAKTLSTAIQTTANPSHRQRYFWCTDGCDPAYPRWTLRNKGNFVPALGDSKVVQHHASEAPLEWGANHTALGQAGPDGKKRLPDEYYALDKGKPNHYFANMANPKVWELCAEYYRDYFYSNPTEDYASISAADAIVLDDRPECRRLDNNEFDWIVGASSSTDRLWFFHRRYLERLKHEHPERKYGVLIYLNNMTPPRLETVHPSMALVFAPLSICPLHHVRDEKCKSNATYRKRFESWMAQKRAVGAEAHYYDYLPIGFQWCNFILSPQWHIIGQNYPWFNELGLDGHTSQGFDDWAANGLSAWVAQRLYWDLKQDYPALVREYCTIRFGETAAPAMAAYYKVFEERMKVVPDLCGNEIYANHIAIDQPTRRQAREVLDKAAPLIHSDRHQKQYQAAVDFQTAMEAWCDGIDHARETGDFAAAAKMMQPAFVIAEKLNAIYPNFIAASRINRKDAPIFAPGGWLKKYTDWDQHIQSAKSSVILPRLMRVALDTDNTAAGKGWHKPEVSIAGLEEWDSTMVPDIKYGTDREVATFFYRAEVLVPTNFTGAGKVVLFFPSLVARGLQLWINGTPVEFDQGSYRDSVWRGNIYFWDNYDHRQSFDVTGLIKPGQTNTVAFRVFKSFDHGGTYDRAFLLADPDGKPSGGSAGAKTGG